MEKELKEALSVGYIMAINDAREMLIRKSSENMKKPDIALAIAQCGVEIRKLLDKIK